MNRQTKYDETSISDCVTVVLKLSGSKERFTGVVTGVDFPAATTAFITSGDQQFLAFQDRKNPLLIGQKVTFRISQHRAIDIEHAPEPEPPQPATELLEEAIKTLEEIPQHPKQEFKNEPLAVALDNDSDDAPLTTMVAAFRNIRRQ